MNKSEFSQLKYISKEIDEIQRQIEDAEYKVSAKIVSDTVIGSSKSLPYVPHVIAISGIEDIGAYGRIIKRFKAKLKRKLDELMDQLNAMEEYISTIPDSEMRLILQYRYINGLSWQEIAAALGSSGDGSTERKKHDRFLKFSLNS